MARFAYFADLPNGETLEWRDSSAPTYVDRMGFQRYRDVPAKVSRCIPAAEPTAGNVLCGYQEGRGWVRADAFRERFWRQCRPERVVCEDA